MLYHAELKNSFIEYRKATVVLPSVNYLENIFNRVGDYENELKRDVYEFSVKDITTYYKMLNIASIKSLQNINTTFSKYYEYCVQNGVIDNIDNPFKITSKADIIATCVNQVHIVNQWFTREQILRMCGAGFVQNALERYVLLALFEGVNGVSYGDIINAEGNDFDGDALVYHAKSGIDYVISKELYHIVEDCLEAEYYYAAKGRKIKFIPSDLVYKETRRGAGNSRSTRDRLLRALRIYFQRVQLDGIFASEFMTPKNIYQAGMLHRINEYIKEHNMSFYEFIFSEKIFHDWMEEYHYIYHDKNLFYTTYRLYFESTT